MPQMKHLNYFANIVLETTILNFGTIFFLLFPFLLPAIHSITLQYV